MYLHLVNKIEHFFHMSLLFELTRDATRPGVSDKSSSGFLLRASPLETQLHTPTLVSRRPTCRLISSSTTCYTGLSGARKGKHKPGTMLKAWSSTLTSMATVLSAAMSTYSCAFFGLRRTRLCRRTSTLKGFSCICRRQCLCTKRLQRTKPCLGLISN